MIWLFVKLAMEFEEPELTLIPKPNQVRIPWQGFTDLRISLIQRGMIKNALVVYRVEVHRTPLEKRSALAEEVIELLSRLPDLPHRAFMLAEVKQGFADTLVELHDLPRAKEMALECNLALDGWCTENEIASKENLPLYLNLQYVKINFIADPLEKLKFVENLLPRAEATCHRRLSQLLDSAAWTARALAEKSDSQEYLAKFYSFRERGEQEDENVQGDICSLIGHRHNLTPVLQGLLDRQKELEWIDGFLFKYPEFRSPAMMVELYTRRVILLNSLNDSDGASEAQKILDRWSILAPTTTGLLHRSWANIVASGDGAVGDSRYDSEDEIDEGQSISEFSKLGSGPEDQFRIIQKLLHFLIDWAVQDVQDGSLEDKRLRELFDLDDNELKDLNPVSLQRLRDNLKARDPCTMFKALFLPKDTKDQDSDHRFKFLSDWLSNPPKGSRNIRLYWMIAFLQTRQAHTLDSRFSDFDIADFERLLELQAKLPRLLKEHTESNIPFWYSGLSWRYMAKFWGGGSWLLFDCWDFALKAEEYCQKSLVAFRKVGNLWNIATQQRMLATINWCKIRRLAIYKALSGSPREMDQVREAFANLSATISNEIPPDDQIRQLQKQGLEWLSETDDILSQSEREASWEDGLSGMKKREELAKRDQNHTTIKTSLQLLLAGPDSLTEEETKLLWNLAQKYKNRLLAMAIGMSRPSPPGLVKKILASNEVGPMYQEMLDLQKKMESAAEKDRFHLRRQLDSHRERMKQYPPLRELINLREGTPIQLGDLEEITEGLNVPAVFVDWIYVPSMIGGGSQLLLLTARAGETPTVDVLSTNIREAAAWADKYLATPGPGEISELLHGHSKETFNKVCGSLVAPLASRTKEDELLVLSPTDFFYRFPLHALTVGVEALIFRNPIVYAHSQTLMRACHLASQYAADSLGPLNPQFISGIGAADSEIFGKGRKSITDLAATFRTSPMIDGSASKFEFLKRAQDSRLLHIHTHCMWDSTNPLDHHFVFPSPPTQAISDISEEGGEHDRLTAREVFDLRIQQGVHINLIACSGGLTDVKVGDEVMGLVPAFLYSGAGSTVSTLWPIPDAAGASFSRGFFEAFLEQIKKLREKKGKANEKVMWIDMAMAFRDAVMELDPEQNLPLLTWAGFVMHGFWMFCVDGKDVDENGVA
jgi:CHAT domain-containing protein